MKWSSFENKNKALFNSFLLKRTQGSSEPILLYIYKLVLGDNTFQQALDTIQNRLKQAAPFRSTLYSDIAPAVHETDSVSAINGSNILPASDTENSLSAFGTTNILPVTTDADILDFEGMADNQSDVLDNGSNILPALDTANSFPAFDTTNISPAVATDAYIFDYEGMADNQSDVLESEYDCAALEPDNPESTCENTENDFQQQHEESDVDNSSFSVMELQFDPKYKIRPASIHVAHENRFSDFLQNHSNYPNTLFIVVLSYFGDIDNTIRKILRHKDSDDVENSVQLSLFKHSKLSSLVHTMKDDDCCKVRLKLDNSENPIDLWLIPEKMSRHPFDMSAILQTASKQNEIYNIMFMPSCTANGKQILDNFISQSDHFYLRNCLRVIVSVSNDFDFKEYGGINSFALVHNTLHERAISNATNSSGATKQKSAGSKKQPSSSTRKSVELGNCHIVFVIYTSSNTLHRRPRGSKNSRYSFNIRHSHVL